MKFTIEDPTRPVCCVDGCDKGAQNTTTSANPKWRRSTAFGGYVCSTHHAKKIAYDNDVTSYSKLQKKRRTEAISEGYDSVYEKNAVDFEREAKIKAKELGVSYAKYIKYKGTGSEYLMFREEYCENIDGRLGHVCTTTIVIDGQLQVDHIDGNPGNNNRSNHQTFCADCHIIKTHLNEDWKTPGRSAIKAAKRAWEPETDLSDFFKDTGITVSKNTKVKR